MMCKPSLRVSQLGPDGHYLRRLKLVTGVEISTRFVRMEGMGPVNRTSRMTAAAANSTALRLSIACALPLFRRMSKALNGVVATLPCFDKFSQSENVEICTVTWTLNSDLPIRDLMLCQQLTGPSSNSEASFVAA